jgi:hypothetical protein
MHEHAYCANPNHFFYVADIETKTIVFDEPRINMMCDTKSHSSAHCVDPHYVSGLRYTYRLDVMRIVQRPIFCEGAFVVGSSTYYHVRLRRLLLAAL